MDVENTDLEFSLPISQKRESGGEITRLTPGGPSATQSCIRPSSEPHERIVSEHELVSAALTQSAKVCLGPLSATGGPRLDVSEQLGAGLHRTP
jgi:hypothetical protein